MDPVVLLVGGLVLFVDHDEAQIGIGQEQGGAGPGHHPDITRCDAGEQSLASAPGHAGMPAGRLDAEAGLEPVEELRRQRDLGHEDQGLAAPAEGFGHGLEINLRLAGARDPFQEGRGGGRVAQGRDQRLRRLRLRLRQPGLAEIRVGIARHRLGGKGDGLQRALVDEAIDHADADPRRLGEVALEHQAPTLQPCALRSLDDLLARRRHALGARLGQAHADPGDLRAALVDQPQAHGERRALRRQGVPGDPFEELPHVGQQRRGVYHPRHGLEVGAGPRAQGPHHAHHLAGRERHLDDVAFLEDEAVRHRVAVGGVQRERDEDVGNLMHAWIRTGSRVAPHERR
jgi:hypothetical protein